jgi:hypothetical protein
MEPFSERAGDNQTGLDGLNFAAIQGVGPMFIYDLLINIGDH